MRALKQTSVGVKVFLVCTFVALLVSALGSAALYHGASSSLRDKVSHQLQSIASTAALDIDTASLGKIRSSHRSSPEYRQLRDVLVQIRNANPGIMSVYVLRTGSVPDTQELISHSDPARLPGARVQIASIPSAWATHCHPGEQSRRRGDKINPFSGYATLRNRDGSIAGILCVEMSPQQLRAEESDLRLAAGETLLLAVLFSLALGFSFTQAVLRPLNAFTRAAERVSEGDFDFRLQIASSDEIADLASTFNSMIASLRDYRNKMIQQSTHDPLTGLSNHMHFHELLNAEVSRANRFGRDLTILIIDIDRFKKVNDSFGHAVGDSVLGELGALIRSNLREIDMPARYGADEFAIILPEASALLGMKIAEQIRASVDKHHFSVASSLDHHDAEFARRSLHITVTIGAATFPRDHHTKEGVLMAADIALCRAKHASRNSTFSYDPDDVAGQHIDPVSLYRMLRSPDMAAIQSLAAAVDARDHYTSGHSARVVAFSMRIADGIEMSPETKDTLRVAALLHDLGKIGIPDSILNKPAKLSAEEVEIVRQHPSVGAGILGRAPQLDGVIPGVLFHHERFDGSGYPQALAGDEIPLIARILAIADSFDAMTSDRPYRAALSVEQAIEELMSNAGTQFDPQLIDVFVDKIKEESDEAAA